MFDRSTLTTIISMLVFSKLCYYSSIWSNATDTNLLKLQAVQNFVDRIICVSRKFDHVTPLLKELHWLPIKSQLLISVTPCLLSNMTGSAPTYLSSTFPTCGEVSGRTTRISQLLHIPRDVDNCRKPGKLPGCESDFSSCKALLISPKCF